MPRHPRGELLAITEAFRQWRHYLAYTETKTTVLTDHLNHTYLLKKDKLTARQVRALDELCCFDFEIVYRAGKANPADGLSRRPDHKMGPKTRNLSVSCAESKFEPETRNISAPYVESKTLCVPEFLKFRQSGLDELPVGVRSLEQAAAAALVGCDQSESRSQTPSLMARRAGWPASSRILNGVWPD